MTDAVDLALFRGALEQLKAYCRDCDTCLIRDTCHELIHATLWGFADSALEELKYKAGFSAAKEAVE